MTTIVNKKGISKGVAARTYTKKSHFSMSAYSSSYAMFVLLYPLYYLYLTNRNTQSSGIIVEIHKIKKKKTKENKKNKNLTSSKNFFPSYPYQLTYLSFHHRKGLKFFTAEPITFSKRTQRSK